MHLRHALLALALVSAVPKLAAAQAAPPPPPPRVEGTAEAAFVGTTGNASTSTFGLSGDVTHRPDSWSIKNMAGFVRNRAEGTTTAEVFLYGLRVEKSHSARLSSFGEYGYFRDEFAGVSHRNALAGGVSVKLLTGPVHLLSADGAVGYLDEKRLAGANVSSATYGGSLAYKWKISSTAEFTDEVRLTGLFDRAEDWRLGHVATVTTKLTDGISLKVSHTIRYAHFPVPGFKKTDTGTSIALVARFARPR